MGNTFPIKIDIGLFDDADVIELSHGFSKDGINGKNGAEGRTRTDTELPQLDFESSASTNFATPARREARDSSRILGW